MVSSSSPVEGPGHDDVWRSDRTVADWVSGSEERERRRRGQRRLMADLLPFEQDASFVLLDLGAGTGAATAAILERYPAATAVLAEHSPQMAEAGTRELEPHRGRFR